MHYVSEWFENEFLSLRCMSYLMMQKLRFIILLSLNFQFKRKQILVSSEPQFIHLTVVAKQQIIWSHYNVVINSLDIRFKETLIWIMALQFIMTLKKLFTCSDSPASPSSNSHGNHISFLNLCIAYKMHTNY